MSAKHKKRKASGGRFERDFKRVALAIHNALAGMCSGGLLLNFEANEAGTVTDVDRQWFEANPGRSVRMRRIMLGELPLEMDGRLLRNATHVLVCQLVPGIRQRWPVPTQATPTELDAVPDSETLLQSLLPIVSDPYGVFTVRDVLYPAEWAGVAH
jgi:hypothetical protein